MGFQNRTARISKRTFLKAGGAGRDRTGDLLNANQALSQLSYSPSRNGRRVDQIAPTPPKLIEADWTRRPGVQPLALIYFRNSEQRNPSEYMEWNDYRRVLVGDSTHVLLERR